MLCVLTPPIFLYYFGAFVASPQLIELLLRKNETLEFTIMLFVCFIRTSEYEMPDLFLPLILRALNDSLFFANKGAPVLPECKRRANVLKFGLLKSISNCVVDWVSTVLAYA